MVARRGSSEVKLLVNPSPSEESFGTSNVPAAFDCGGHLGGVFTKVRNSYGSKAIVRIPKEVFDFDYEISLTVPKTHDTVGVTLGIKNFLMGVIKQEDKSLMHGLTKAHSVAAFIIQQAPWQFNWFFNNYLSSGLKDKFTGFGPQIYQKSVVCLHQNLFRLGKKIMPDLVVIDGWWGMEGDGPVYGRRRNLGVAIASTDPIAADAVGAKVIGFEPEKIGYLRLLAKAGKRVKIPKV